MKRAKTELGVLCITVLCITLALGLWPFHAPHNEVSWLNHTNGVAFGRFGTIQSSVPLKVMGSRGGSIEMWLQPERWIKSATILSLYKPEESSLVSLRQSLTDLEVQAVVEQKPLAAPKARFSVDDALGRALRRKQPVVITVTSGRRGTKVYLDGTLAAVAPQFCIPDTAFASRLIVGDSPNQPDSFRGRIFGLAIFGSELNAAQVWSHYQAWTQNGRPDIVEEERSAALYLFNEHAENAIHNSIEGGGDLYLPARYRVVDKTFMEPLWKEFNLSRSYWSGNVKNIVGFVPGGLCWMAYLMARSVKRAMLFSIILGIVVSVTIEILQAWLPTRDSGTTDVITNTLGTYLGAVCYRKVQPSLARRLSSAGVQCVERNGPGQKKRKPI